MYSVLKLLILLITGTLTEFDLLNKFPSYTDFGKEIIPEALGRGDKLKSYVFNDY